MGWRLKRLTFFVLLSVAGAAWALDTAPPAVATPENFDAFSKAVIAAVADGKWPAVAALALVAAVWALRKFIAPSAPFFATGEGGAVLNVLTSFAGAIATALFTGVTFTPALLWTSLQLSLLASGGWSLLKYLLPLLLKIPFLATIFARGSAPAAVSDAEKKGLAAAVVAKPPKSDELANGP